MVELPTNVQPKTLASCKTAYYFNVPTWFRKLKCPVENEPLGTDYIVMKARAEVLNGKIDEWNAARKGEPVVASGVPKYGTVDWLFREYKISAAYLDKVAVRSRGDYEWAMDQICNIKTKKGDRVGERIVKSVDPRAADKLYKKFLTGEVKEGEKATKNRLRTGEKLVGLCRKAWRVVHRLFPDEFDKQVPNPWTGVTLKVRAKAKKHAVTRDQVYSFAYGAIDLGEVEIAAAAVICFEWLQRPENVIGGHIKWTGYRTPGEKPTIRIEHHKTGEIVNHPLEDRLDDGTVIKFYEEAEEILAKLPRLGIPMILHKRRGEVAKRFAQSSVQHIVQRVRKELNLPAHFTLDACRHGGMTELEEAELTDGQGRALSAHRTQQSYAGYAKRTEKRMLSATRKRFAHVLADKAVENEAETSLQNEHRNRLQNKGEEQKKISK